MSHVTEKRQQEKQRRANVRPPNHACDCLSVNRMRGKKKAGQQAPRSSTEKRATEGREEGSDQRVQHHVQQVVAPGTQAVQGVVEAEGEGAERTEGLVAAAVSEQGAPEVVVQDVGPWSLRKKVLVGLDGSAERSRRNKLFLTMKLFITI